MTTAQIRELLFGAAEIIHGRKIDRRGRRCETHHHKTLQLFPRIYREPNPEDFSPTDIAVQREHE